MHARAATAHLRTSLVVENQRRLALCIPPLSNSKIQWKAYTGNAPKNSGSHALPGAFLSTPPDPPPYPTTPLYSFNVCNYDIYVFNFNIEQ